MSDFETETDSAAIIENHCCKLKEGLSQGSELLKQRGLIFQDGQLVIDHQIEAPQCEQDKADILLKIFSGQLLDGKLIFEFFNNFFNQIPVVVKLDDFDFG